MRWPSGAKGTVCDVTIKEQVEALADFAWKKFGKVDVLVNNAGVGSAQLSVFDITKEQIMKVLDINLFGVWNGVSVFGKRMIEQGTHCAIYNLGSENSFFNAVPRGSEYVTSKFAVHAMTTALREEAPDFMDVSLICPGLVNSDLGENGIDFGMDTDKYTSIAMKQIKENKFYVVSHSYNMERIEKQNKEIKDAYEEYAPRYEGDDEFDVRTLMSKIMEQQNQG